MKSLDWNSDRLLVPDRRRRVVMYRDELPTSLVQQVTEIRDRAFFAVVESHHLSARKDASSVFRHSLSLSFAYHDIGIIRHGRRATQVAEQRLRRYRNLCAWDLVCSGFVTNTCHQLVNDDKLRLWTSSDAQVFQYGKAILIRPVMKYLAEQEDGDVVLLCWLWFKKTMALEVKRQCAAW